MLQQYLPFTVLKLHNYESQMIISSVATVLTVYGIETLKELYKMAKNDDGCNSTYRLRY